TFLRRDASSDLNLIIILMSDYKMRFCIGIEPEPVNVPVCIIFKCKERNIAQLEYSIFVLLCNLQKKPAIAGF
ncbi:MAG: hypothetical protein WC951_12375, partial [Bacteroidales bacterium]